MKNSGRRIPGYAWVFSTGMLDLNASSRCTALQTREPVSHRRRAHSIAVVGLSSDVHTNVLHQRSAAMLPAVRQDRCSAALPKRRQRPLPDNDTQCSIELLLPSNHHEDGCGAHVQKLPIRRRSGTQHGARGSPVRRMVLDDGCVLTHYDDGCHGRA